MLCFELDQITMASHCAVIKHWVNFNYISVLLIEKQFINKKDSKGGKIFNGF